MPPVRLPKQVVVYGPAYDKIKINKDQMAPGPDPIKFWHRFLLYAGISEIVLASLTDQFQCRVKFYYEFI